MATKTVHEMLPLPEHWQAEQGSECIGCSIGIMAHNEEANIGRTIRAVLEQQSPSFLIEEVIVVASGCTIALSRLYLKLHSRSLACACASRRSVRARPPRSTCFSNRPPAGSSY